MNKLVLLILLMISPESTNAFVETILFARQYHHQVALSATTQEPTSSRSSTQDDTTTTTTSTFWSREQLDQYANQQGVLLSLTTLGPGYRAIARSKQNSTQILAYVEGFVRGPILHLDRMEVFRHIVKKVRQENPEFKGGGTVLGVGLLPAYLSVLHGWEQNCNVGEFLAIDDEEFQHKRLVRLYKHAGFQYVKYVGDDWKDIPDRMVWGGCGTLLRQDTRTLLESWTHRLESSIQQ